MAGVGGCERHRSDDVPLLKNGFRNFRFDFRRRLVAFHSTPIVAAVGGAPAEWSINPAGMAWEAAALKRCPLPEVRCCEAI